MENRIPFASFLLFELGLAFELGLGLDLNRLSSVLYFTAAIWVGFIWFGWLTGWLVGWLGIDR